MESGGGVYPAGKWIKVHCQKTTTVVCERIQTWTLATLQNMFLNNKLEQEQLKQKISILEKELEKLKQYPGFHLTSPMCSCLVRILPRLFGQRLIGKTSVPRMLGFFSE